MELISKYKIIFYMAIILAMVEVGLEYRSHERGWKTIIFSFKQPSASHNNHQEKTKYGPTADFPFRSPVIAQKKAKNTRRIWIASSSYGEDVYTAPEKIFPNRIQGFLQHHGTSRIQILNASKAGNTISKNIIDIKNNAPKWHPDIIVLYQMSNDITKLVSNRGINNTAKQDDAAIDNSIFSLLPVQGQKLEHIYERTTLYSNSKSLISPLVTKSKLLINDVDPKILNAFRNLLDQFISTSLAFNTKVVLCTFALSHGPNSINNPPAKIINSIFKFNKILSYKGWQNYVAAFNDIIRKKAHENNLILIDIASQMTGRSALFKDFFHFNENGHKNIADIIANNEEFIEAVNLP